MNNTIVLKKGFCHLINDSLIISRSSNPEDESPNGKFNFMNVFLGIVFLLTLFYCYQQFARESYNLSTVYGIAAGIIGLNLILNWNKSGDTTIPVAGISKIEYRSASTLTSDFFVIKYVLKGKTKQRVLMMNRDAAKNNQLAKAKKILSTITEIKEL